MNGYDICTLIVYFFFIYSALLYFLHPYHHIIEILFYIIITSASGRLDLNARSVVGQCQQWIFIFPYKFFCEGTLLHLHFEKIENLTVTMNFKYKEIRSVYIFSPSFVD